MSKGEFGKAVSIWVFEPKRTKSRKKKNFNKEMSFQLEEAFTFHYSRWQSVCEMHC